MKQLPKPMYQCGSKVSISIQNNLLNKFSNPTGKFRNKISCPFRMRAILGKIKASTKTTNFITKKTAEMTCKARKAISAKSRNGNFRIFTSVPIMVASQGDTKLNKLPAHPQKIIDTAM